MCNQTAGSDADRVISSQANSNQAKNNHQAPNTNLVAPLLPKTPTTTKDHPNDQLIILTTTPKSTTTLATTKTHRHFFSQFSSSFKEARAIAEIAFPMILTGILLYSRSMISMLFLGRLGDLALAGGSLAIGFANITGYSILSGLAMGMEPICGQAFGAQKHSLLGLTLYRTILFLLLTSLPIGLLWLNMERILLLFGQDRAIAGQAQIYLLYSLPDLLAQSVLHPLRIYLRTQSITLPLTYTSGLAILFVHLPLNFLMVVHLDLGLKGVALASVATNFAMLLFLIAYILLFIPSSRAGLGPAHLGTVFTSRAGLAGLVGLAVPSCISVCLEWWWYEIMILLCGLLANPEATVASMGILIQTTSLIYIFPSSLSASLSTRVGNELGAGRPDRAKRAAVTGLFFSYLTGILAVFFTIIVRGKWASMFTDDTEIIKLTTLVLPIIGLCELGNCPQTTGCGVLRGTARPKVGANINLGCFYLVGMPVAVWLGFYAGFDFEGLWFGLLAAQGSCVVTMMVVLYRTDWEFEAQKAKDLTDNNNGYSYCEVLVDDKDLEINKDDDQTVALLV